MKKAIYLLYFFSFLLSQNTGWTQAKETINSTPIEIGINNLSFATNNRPDFHYSDSTVISNLKIRVSSGDLHIYFDLSTEADEYNIKLEKIENLDTKKEFPIARQYIYGDVANRIPAYQGPHKKIIIANLASNSNPRLLTGNIKIVLRVETIEYPIHTSDFWGIKFKCNEEAKKWHQKGEIWIPPLGVSLVGVGLLAWNKDHTATYHQYKSYPRNIGATEEDYKTANQIRNNERKRDVWGVALVTASVVWVLAHMSRDRDLKKTFCKNCTEEKEPSKDCKKLIKKEKKRKGKLSLELFDHQQYSSPYQPLLLGEDIAIGIRYTF